VDGKRLRHLGGRTEPRNKFIELRLLRDSWINRPDPVSSFHFSLPQVSLQSMGHDVRCDRNLPRSCNLAFYANETTAHQGRLS
jgi:hypothetical protein